MRLLIATVQTPFIRGGAELLASELEKQLVLRGHQAEIVTVPFKNYPAACILDHMLACRLLDVSESCGMKVDRMIGLKFPAYLFPHPNKVLWMVHQHRPAYDLWSHPQAGDLQYQDNGTQVRDAIHKADTTLIPEYQARFAISGTVAARLRKFNGIDAQPLYQPPPRAGVLHCGEAEDYLFFPSRLNPLKRQTLILEALAKTKNPVKVWFAGAADHPSVEKQCHELAERLGLNDRVRWLGAVNEGMADLYARSIAVIFPPVDEDYGFITIEAMLSSKPLLTCTDSGGPLEFVLDAQTGFIVPPTPEACAEAMDRLWEDRAASKRMGQAARDRYDSMNVSWDHVIGKLLA
jgi:glycosyltransferase involved in cell wall biosynthesis